ncbi:DUF998 domain-containing protein [Diaminobutyricimonas aerilata]|nr:DUF998 domain-containing protein [Diaminobutyricimonas aerilata]
MSSPAPTVAAALHLRREGDALGAAAIGAVVGVLVGLIAFWNREAPLGGTGSIGGIAALTAALVGAPVFALVYVRHSRRQFRWTRRSPVQRAVDTAGLTLTGAGMALLLIVSVFTVLQLAFRDLSLDTPAATTLVGATVAATTYALALIASEITTRTLTSLLGLFLVAGVFASMLTADDPTWWHRNFSALGAGGAASAQAFNLTLIIGGLVITTLADYLTTDLTSRRRPGGGDLRGVGVIRMLLVLAGVLLIGVGLVPVDADVILHNVFATSAVVVFAVLIALVPTLLRGLPKSFVLATAVFEGGLVVIVLLFWPVGYYNLTAVELLSVVVILAWLILFTRQAEAQTAAVSAAAARAAALGPVRAPARAAVPSTSAPVPRAALAIGVLIVGALIGALLPRRTR